jgi:hypothetical protein
MLRVSCGISHHRLTVFAVCIQGFWLSFGKL